LAYASYGASKAHPKAIDSREEMISGAEAVIRKRLGSMVVD
jgi:hypothetical protein